MKILAAIDGSEVSLRALDGVLARTAWFAAPLAIDLICVHARVPYGAAAAWAGKEAVQHYYDDESDAALAPAVDRLVKAGVTHNTIKAVGDPAEEIVRHAVEGRYDLVTMGTHGHTRIKRLVLGSVATKVVAQSPVPILLLK